MANASIGGLVSGLDTATIISQLMQLEARPQTMLKSRVTTEQKVVTALQALNTKLAGIATKAAELAKATAWSPSKATCDNAKVLVTADSGASATSLSFTVSSLASSARESFPTTGAAATTVMGANLSYQITYADGRPAETINTGDGTMQAIADDINRKQGVRATLVKVGDVNGTPTYQLQVSSTVTGSQSGFTFTQFDPAAPTTPLPSPIAFMGEDPAAPPPVGTDAEILLDGQATPLSSRSNTITDLMPGVDVTLSAGAQGTSATITVERDVASLSDSVKAMVDAVNSVLDEVSDLTAYDATTRKAGLLGGDSTLRTIRNQLLESVSRGIGNQSLAPYGVQTDRSGRLVFDADKFKAAYGADPTGTAAKFAAPDPAPVDPSAPTGLAATLERLGKTFSNSLDGTITLAIKSRQSGIKGMEDDIADWDVRLAARQTTLQRQYTALETALGKLQSQSSWLAGQIGSLPSMSKG